MAEGWPERERRISWSMAAEGVACNLGVGPVWSASVETPRRHSEAQSDTLKTAKSTCHGPCRCVNVVSGGGRLREGLQCMPRRTPTLPETSKGVPPTQLRLGTQRGTTGVVSIHHFHSSWKGRSAPTPAIMSNFC